MNVTINNLGDNKLRLLAIAIWLLVALFFMYEFYLQKKTNKEILQKFKNLTNDNTSDINYLPASEHPIIKAAKQRLKD